MSENTEKKKPAELSASIKEKYKMKPGFAPGLYRHKGNNIDTSNCTLDEIEAAIKNGFDVVEAIKPATPVK